MSAILELGPAIAAAPEPYQNFIRQQCAGFKRPLHKDDINTVLAEEPYQVILCRHKKKTNQTVYNISTGRTVKADGDWYLKFKDDAALLAFQLRWS